MSRYYSVLIITVVVINGLHCNYFQKKNDREKITETKPVK